MRCLVVTSNSVKLKSISSWPNLRAKTTENHFCFYFHFKWLPALENRRERERARKREREREKERRESRDRPKPSSPISSKAELADIVHRHHRHNEVSGFDDFFLGFVCVLRNEWYYIFVWQPRKCEQQVENVFSMVFSRIQPNTRKYFLKYFLKCNQTHENIFLSGK